MPCSAEYIRIYILIKEMTPSCTETIDRKKHYTVSSKPYLSDLSENIRKTCPCHVNPIGPTFIQKNWDMQGYIYFLIFAPKYRLCVIVRTASPRRFLRVPTICVFSKDKKTIKFSAEKFQILKIENLCLLPGQVFVMSPY